MPSSKLEKGLYKNKRAGFCKHFITPGAEGMDNVQFLVALLYKTPIRRCECFTMYNNQKQTTLYKGNELNNAESWYLG
jgi:hypothetical protein